MISRVTNQTLMRTAQLSLHANMTRMAKLQDQATDQRAITRPSDDPTATVKQYKIDLAVSNAALIAIGKEMGMFVDGGKNTPDEKEIFDVSTFSDEKLEKLEKLLDTSINDA